MSNSSKINITYSVKGIPRYHMEIRHRGLSKFQVVRGDNEYIVKQKAMAIMKQWDAMWEKRNEKETKINARRIERENVEGKKQHAIEKTEEALKCIEELKNTLIYTLSIDDTINWNSLKNRTEYPAHKPEKASIPAKANYPQISKEPQKTDPEFSPKYNIIDYLFKKIKTKKELRCLEIYNNAYKAWEKSRNELIKLYNESVQKHEYETKKAEERYIIELEAWNDAKAKFLQEQLEENSMVDKKMEQYLKKDREAVLDYCSMVLDNSRYPDYFPQSYEMDFNSETGILIVDYNLPNVDAIPRTIDVKYVQSKDEFLEKKMSDSELNKLYDELLYQIILRTIHELFEADKADALVSVVINGYVHSTDRSTGKEYDACVLSIQAKKDEFIQINLEKVDPKACFKKLKGVGSSKLHSLTPIPPLLKINKEDSRFVASYGVAQDLNEGYNLATMDWEDFEHLIRELFEKEFSHAGGEVKVTRASRDGGVDAVIFDPDPIRGGKIVVQAKRYTNTVGVSAVRDLYGTLLNEGANKGILVTTSDYGPDAYEFAKGKPIVLLSGGNLLHLLDKHGHRARIDIKEAREILLKQDHC